MRFKRKSRLKSYEVVQIKLPTIGIQFDSREFDLRFESYPDFRSALHGEAYVIFAVDCDEIHHAVPEVGLIFRDGFFAFFQERKVMLDGLAAGILAVDFSLHCCGQAFL